MVAATIGTDGSATARRRRNPVGLRFIVAYKFIKGSAELLIGTLLLYPSVFGLNADLSAAAAAIRHHVVEAWAPALAEWLIHAETARDLFIVAVAALADGVITLIEGLALHRRYRWSRWIVVGATASFLPFEVAALVRHPGAGRVALILVNASIVFYLMRRQSAFASVESIPSRDR
jgi:Predicted membrane protein (DUF2127)